MTDSPADAASDDPASARIAANQSVLVTVQRSQADGPDGEMRAPVFKTRSGQEETAGLVPRIDAGLDSGHRYAVLGAVFRPMRQFLRRTLDGAEDVELSSDLRTGDSPTIGKD